MKNLLCSTSALLSVQCQFKNTSYLEIDFQTDILSPGAVMEVPVSFYPRETCRYHEKLSFILNSCVTKQVEILGQGIEMKVREKSVSVSGHWFYQLYPFDCIID